jgi:FkbM family methyltransferase
MKILIKKIINRLGYDIIRKEKKVSFDDILKINIKKSSPIIIDVGANEGQSIIRFRKKFPNSIIHSFEPNFEAFKLLKRNFDHDSNIIINNKAVGDINENKTFYETKKTTHSSFNKINNKSEWIKIRSKEYNTTIAGYTENEREVEVITLDEYCNENNLNNIDLLKIDTQGYEEEVLNGSKNLIKENKIKLIETEVMLDDVYQRNISIFDIEKNLQKTHRLIGIKKKKFNNIYEGYVFSLDLMYLKK